MPIFGVIGGFILDVQAKDPHFEDLQSWVGLDDAWRDFTRSAQALQLRPGPQSLADFLRAHQPALIKADAIRLARARRWIAHTERFPRMAFDLLTGVKP